MIRSENKKGFIYDFSNWRESLVSFKDFFSFAIKLIWISFFDWVIIKWRKPQKYWKLLFWQYWLLYFKWFFTLDTMLCSYASTIWLNANNQLLQESINSLGFFSNPCSQCLNQIFFKSSKKYIFFFLGNWVNPS